MHVAQIRKKAILVLLDDFRFTINGTTYVLNTTIGTYFMNLTDLFAARLGQYVKCSYFPEPLLMGKNFDSLGAKARELRQQGYDYVGFVSKDYIQHPSMPSQGEGFNWGDFTEQMVFVKFEADQWELMVRNYGLDPFQAAIFHGVVWMLSHELGHLVAWDFNQTNHGWDYIAMQNFAYYDQRFNIIPNPDWGILNWHMIATRLPEPWMASG